MYFWVEFRDTDGLGLSLMDFVLPHLGLGEVGPLRGLQRFEFLERLHCLDLLDGTLAQLRIPLLSRLRAQLVVCSCLGSIDFGLVRFERVDFVVPDEGWLGIDRDFPNHGFERGQIFGFI